MPRRNHCCLAAAIVFVLLAVVCCRHEAICSPVSSVVSPRIVQTHYGALRGVIDRFGQAVSLHPVEKFLGVPYATPPINGLRFMPPLTPTPWEGIKLADQSAPACPQRWADTSQRRDPSSAVLPKYVAAGGVGNVENGLNALNVTSEDCLYLNIFYPTIGEYSINLLMESSTNASYIMYRPCPIIYRELIASVLLMYIDGEAIELTCRHD